MPLLIRNQEEFDYVFERVKSSLEEDIKDDGFRVLTWSTAGWLYFFSKSRLTTPDELKNLKMAASQGEMELIRAYQLMGYQAIAVPYTERLAALASGMVEAYLSVPILAAGFQWFATTPYMMDLQIGPAPGGILMSERAYRMLPQESRDEMIEFAQEVGAELNADILELENEAIETMSEFGLTIVGLSDGERETWIEELEDSYEVMIGSVFDEPFYTRIRELLSDYRESR
jgi:TRAP-type C4-dicarboxylate transport system substrate-binding protein